MPKYIPQFYFIDKTYTFIHNVVGFGFAFVTEVGVLMGAL